MAMYVIIVEILTPIIAIHTPNFTVRDEKILNFSDFLISRVFLIHQSRENKKVVKIYGFTVLRHL